MTQNSHKTSGVYFLSLGSNEGNRVFYLRKAAARIEENEIKILKASSIYETQPMELKAQPDFLNQAVKIETPLPPDMLLKCVKAVEKQCGRKKTVRFGPRTLDIDILWWDGGRVKKKNLIIPHPRACTRKFVLVPWAEIAGKSFRLKGKTLREWIKQINESDKDMEQRVIVYELPGRKAARKRINQIASLRSQ